MYRTISLVALAAAAALAAVAPASADRWGGDVPRPTASMLDAREQAFAVKQVVQPEVSSPDSRVEPVRDDRFTIDAAGRPATITASGGDALAWPQVGIGLALAIAIGLGLVLAARATQTRPPVAR